MRLRAPIILAAVTLLPLAAGPGAARAQFPDEIEEAVEDEAERQVEDEVRREGGPVVGEITMTLDGETRVFEVREGPVDEGFATGYSEQPRAGAMVLGASLMGRERGSGATVTLTVGVWRESMEHMCDPFTNQLRYSPADERRTGGRLRPGEEPSESCPPPPDGGRGGLAVHINLSEATLDEDAGTLRVAGTFAGPLGRGDDAPQVSDGRFEAALRPFDDL